MQICPNGNEWSNLKNIHQVPPTWYYPKKKQMNLIFPGIGIQSIKVADDIIYSENPKLIFSSTGWMFSVTSIPFFTLPSDRGRKNETCYTAGKVTP